MYIVITTVNKINARMRCLLLYEPNIIHSALPQ